MRTSRQVDWINICGRWTRYSLLELSDADSIYKECLTFLMIPGNPGNERFYEHFGRSLLEKYAKERGSGPTRFIAVSHLNHVPLPKEYSTGAHSSSHRFTLEEQIQHKADFVRSVDPKAKGRIVLIGHSIGAHISLKILPQLIADGYNVSDCYALFPALEQMHETPSGRRIHHLIRTFHYLDWLTLCITRVLCWLPSAVRRWICQANLGQEAHECVVDAAEELWSVSVARNIIHMTKHELATVLEFDEKLLGVDECRLLFYNAVSDGWCPLEFAERMQLRLNNPSTGTTNAESKVLIDEHGCQHAFVMSERETDLVAGMVVENLGR